VAHGYVNTFRGAYPGQFISVGRCDMPVGLFITTDLVGFRILDDGVRARVVGCCGTPGGVPVTGLSDGGTLNNGTTTR
jgi:hypothetical protein